MRARWTVPVALAALVAVGLSIGGAPAAAKSSARVVRLIALDGSARAQSRIVEGRTIVSSPTPGSVTVVLNEPLELRVVDAGGDRVALATPLATGADPYRPGGRSTTRLVVADLRTGYHQAYDIPRNIEPEAFGVASSGDFLFVVDHRPAENPSSYRVGSLNLVDGRFQGLLGPTKTPLDVDMRGHGRQQVMSASGAQLYTLYLEHAHDEATGGTAFVHVLDLGGGWAYCVDLPGVGHGPDGSARIRLTRNGEALVVTDHHAGTRLTIETATLATGRMASGAPPPVEEHSLRR